MTSLASGQSVGRYRVVRFLGAGAMGEVYLAEDPHIERQLAIKTVRLAGRPQEIEDRKKRLLREARAAGRLLHPFIVTLFDAGEVEGLLFLAFEFVEGEDLGSRLAAGWKPSLGEVLRIVRQTAEALDYAHGQGIVHRDIKPSNVLLDTTGRVKVADFGIAKMAGQSTELTVAGAVMGSPQYLSPEQIRGDDLDGRSDVFSLGVLLYELLSGRRPFEGDSITTLVYQILHKEPLAVTGMRPLPPRLEILLRHMLQKDRDQRIASASKVAEELAALERELPAEVLVAPAAATGQMDVTHVLPRRTTAPQGRVVPPPPPPPSPPTLSAPSPRAAPPAVVGAAAVAAAPVQPARPGSAGRWIAVAAALLLVAALVGVWTIWKVMSRREPEPVAAASTAGQPGQSPAPAILPGAPGSNPAASPSPPAADRVEPSPSPASPQQQARESQATAGETGGREPLLRERLERGRVSAPGSGSPGAAGVRPEPSPSESEATEMPAAEPALTPGRTDEPLAAPEAAPVSPPADQTLRTGLNLAFRVTPADAFVLVDRTPIGRAAEWNGLKGNRAYTLPGPGQYRVRIRRDGMREHRILVEAAEAGGITPVTVRLQPLPAAQVETSDLRLIRVRQAVAFRVKPPGAMVSIDGQPPVPARQYSGGRFGQQEWLELTPGKHRLIFSAPGLRREDVAVEVTGGAEREREKFDVVLRPE